jgi:hypothetical protein
MDFSSTAQRREEQLLLGIDRESSDDRWPDSVWPVQIVDAFQHSVHKTFHNTREER